MNWLVADAVLLFLLTLALAGWVEAEEWPELARRLRRPV